MTVAVIQPARPASPQRLQFLRMMKVLLPYGLRRWPTAGAVGGVALLKIGLDVLRPWPMKVVVDNVIDARPLPASLASAVAVLPGGETPRGLLTWAVAATLVIFLGGWLLSLAKAVAEVSLGARLVHDLAADLFDHLQRLSLRYHIGRSTGDLMVRITKDTKCISAILQDALLPAASAVVALVAIVSVMGALSLSLTLAALAAIPVMLIAFVCFTRPMEQRGYLQQEAEGRLWSVAQRALNTVVVVQAFNAEQRSAREFETATNESLSRQLDLVRVQVAFRTLIGLAMVLGGAGVLWLGAHQVMAGTLTIGTILVFLSYLHSLYKPLSTLAYTGLTTGAAAGKARRVLEVLDEEHEVKDLPHARSLPQVRGHVRLEKVTFGYEPQRPVLHEVSLQVQPNQTLALVGPTGAGKSTIANLLLRLMDPQGGRVTLDEHDLRDVKVSDLRRQVAWVPQEPFLFPISIAQNIAYGRPEARHQEIEQAARAAGADGFVRQLPQGYETVVGERGATLSVGQRQRIGIARALLRGARVLVLDEPTSALDADTEAAVTEALHQLGQSHCVILIAHRLSTVRHADRVAVLDHGRIVEFGTPDELVKRDGRFARMLRLQDVSDGEVP